MASASKREVSYVAFDPVPERAENLSSGPAKELRGNIHAIKSPVACLEIISGTDLPNRNSDFYGFITVARHWLKKW